MKGPTVRTSIPLRTLPSFSAVRRIGLTFQFVYIRGEEEGAIADALLFHYVAALL